MRMLVPHVMSVIGPSMFFVWGRESWPIVVAAATLTCGLLGAGWAWRARGPDFVLVALTAAIVVWVGSAWLAVALGV